jgi:hypothetical protein
VGPFDGGAQGGDEEDAREVHQGFEAEKGGCLTNSAPSPSGHVDMARRALAEASRESAGLVWRRDGDALGFVTRFQRRETSFDDA